MANNLCKIPELAGIQEAAEELGVSKSTIVNLRNFPKENVPFPTAVAELHCGPIWRKQDIIDYGEKIQHIMKQKYDACVNTDPRIVEGIPLDSGWDMKAIWRIRKLLVPAVRVSLLQHNGWMDYYCGLTKHDPHQP